MKKVINITRLIFFFTVLALVIFTGLRLVEADKERPKRTTVMKEATGEISGLGADYIAIIYDRKGGHDYEILIPLNKKNIAMVHKRTLQDVKVGDRVGVQYEEVTDDYKGKKSINFKAKTITFLKAAEKQPDEENMYISTPGQN